jgi:hypothetical protein
MPRLIAIAFLFVTSQAWAAFGYYSPISINSSQVPSTQTDFPVLVNTTDARFKSVGNGGHVQSSSGFDIRPYTDSTLTTAITGYELELYNASTGEVVMWVKVSSLSSSTTPFVLAYGDSGISTDGSSSTTWSNSFVAVYHLKDGSTLSVADSANAKTTTNHSATATSGQIDGATNVASASSQYIDISSLSSGAAGITVSAWVNPTSLPNAYNGVTGACDGGTGDLIAVKSNGKLAVYISTSGGLKNYDGTGSHTLSTATWYYVTATQSASTGIIGYVNAASDGTATAAGTTVSWLQTEIGQDCITSGRFWNGKLDEVRYSSVARSANWITTEYNNQSAPGTFETLGTEVSLTTTANGWFYFFP